MDNELLTKAKIAELRIGILTRKQKIARLMKEVEDDERELKRLVGEHRDCLQPDLITP